MNRQVAEGAIDGLWRGYPSACPEGSTILCALVAVTQAGGGSSVLNLCAKDQANENCKHRSGYEGESLAHFPHCFFIPSFSSSLQGLEPSQNP